MHRILCVLLGLVYVAHSLPRLARQVQVDEGPGLVLEATTTTTLSPPSSSSPLPSEEVIIDQRITDKQNPTDSLSITAPNGPSPAQPVPVNPLGAFVRALQQMSGGMGGRDLNDLINQVR